MNQAHYHLFLNHLPIIGTLFGILTLAAGFIFTSNHVKRTALGIFIVAAVFAVPGFLTGEGAEEVVEGLPGVSENIIEEHEELASLFIWLTSTLGIVSLLTLYADVREKSFRTMLYGLTLVLCIATMVLAQQVGTTGGAIRHTEIRSAGTGNAVDQNGQESDKDDDD
ncbi:MAG: hypothetical protein JNM57_07550 [Cyclobacteriaceae bacterium]|nr:hypothetical protein [Cyclobacteriaceae bacterium]